MIEMEETEEERRIRIEKDFLLREKILAETKRWEKEQEEIKRKQRQIEEDFIKNWGSKFEYEKYMILYEKEINRRKKQIVRKYGTDPTICFFYYLHNAVNYVGEENLRKSFASLVGQGDEVIIGNYMSTDNTKEIAEEYGFKVVDIETVPGITLAQSKVKNKTVKETKCNFMVECDVHIEYPNNITNIIREWIKKNDVTKKMLVLRGLWINENGDLQREYSFGPAVVFYTPYLLEARGYDERCYMGYGATHYSVSLMLDVFKLEFDDVYLDTMIHKYHIPEKTKTLELFYNVDDMSGKHMDSVAFGQELARRLINNFDEEVKNVRNSYW